MKHPLAALLTVLTLAACSSGVTAWNEDAQNDQLCFCSSDEDCDDGNPCTKGACAADCTCAYTPVADGLSCLPAHPCLLEGSCQQGSCISPGSVECTEQDGNPCTLPQCNPGAKSGESVCQEEPVADGTVSLSFCSQQVCNGGVVTETLPTQAATECTQKNEALDGKSCVQSYTCVNQTKSCVPTHKEDGTQCWQGTDKCMGFACQAGQCLADNELDMLCEPPAECQTPACGQCTEFKCDPKDGACKAVKLTGECDDTNPCTVGDQCTDGSNPMYGQCKGMAKSCDDGKVCTVDACDPTDGHCVNTPKNENCPGTNNLCVSQLFCDPFALPGADPDQDGCVVIWKPVGTYCNDSDGCTSGDICTEQNGSLFCLGKPIDVDDGNPCTNDWCDPEAGPLHEDIPNCSVPCNPGEQLTGPCGNCGIHTKTCPPSGKWVDAPWGSCTGEGSCTPDQSQTEPCGNCGTRLRICQENCIWSAWGLCANEGECSAGESLLEPCGPVCTNKVKSCSSECTWGLWSECQQFGDCMPNQNDTVSCGKCGTKTRTCTAACTWGNFGGCQNEGLCSPFDSKQQACGIKGTQTAICNNTCFWDPWGPCIENCACGGGTCCSNGCDYDKLGTACGGSECKQCNGSGSCLNKNNGTPCSLGECYNGSCVQCVGTAEKDCDPNCGVFSDFGDGEQHCQNNQWGTCKPVWCKNSPFGEVFYSAAPLDHDWHCFKNDNINIYLCVSVYLSWICAGYLEVDLMKSNNVYGTDEAGPWDNDIKVVLRNVDTGKTYTQSKVDCKGKTYGEGGCFFDVGLDTFGGTLGLSGTHSFEVDIYSPYTAASPVGKTGTVKVKKCF